MVRHDTRIDKKIAGPAWNEIRGQLQDIHEVLLKTSESTASELTTIYVKYKVRDEPLGGTFAVLWVKTPKNVVLGLATPEQIDHKAVTPAPQGMTYKGLTSYLKIEAQKPIPDELSQWAMTAFTHVCNQS